MQCVVYDVLLQCCFIASTSLLSTNHLLWIYWCVITVVTLHYYPLSWYVARYVFYAAAV